MTLYKISKIAFILILLIFAVGCKSEQKEKDGKNRIASNLLSSKIVPGFPEILTKVEKDLPFKIHSYSKLNSNNDSIQIYVGQLKQGNKFGEWVAIVPNDTLNQFQTITYNFDAENALENQFDIEYNNSKNRVSVRISDFDTVNYKVKYAWINTGKLSDTLIVQKIEVPLAKGNYMKNIELTNINEEKININELNDEILVLNWWAVRCAPCRKEIPGLNELKEKYSDKNVRFIAVTNDSKKDVKGFLKDNKFEYEMMFINQEDQNVFGNSYPKNFIIDSSNKITYYSEGGNSDKHKEIESNLSILLRSEE